jgi:hypothetical protein
MRPYLITAKLMRPSNMKRFPTPGLVLGLARGMGKTGGLASIRKHVEKERSVRACASVCRVSSKSSPFWVALENLEGRS